MLSVYIHIYVYNHVYIYVHIYTEREREMSNMLYRIAYILVCLNIADGRHPQPPALRGAVRPGTGGAALGPVADHHPGEHCGRFS